MLIFLGFLFAIVTSSLLIAAIPTSLDWIEENISSPFLGTFLNVFSVLFSILMVFLIVVIAVGIGHGFQIPHQALEK